MSLEEYRRFIASRAGVARTYGFDPKPINASAKAHQVTALEFALNAGKSAAFLDTGLGKSFIELEFARQCANETGKPSLILTPLAVAGQMIREGVKFGIDARQIKEQHEVGAGVMVANYERLPRLDPASFGAIILDESSILKSFAGRTRNMLMDAFKDTPYKLAATATPSPNDHTELGNHAEFLGVMRQQEMLSKWFINDTSTASQDWRLKGHAVESFWSWVASWSRCATLPSDLGGDDTGYVLPEIDRKMHTVHADRQSDTDGMLFRIPELSATSFHKEKKLTIEARCERASSIVFFDICTKLAKAWEDYDTWLGNRNTKKIGSAEKKLTQNTKQGAILKDQERRKKTQSICENTTSTTQRSSREPESSKTRITHAGEIDTYLTQNTRMQSKMQLGEDAQKSVEMKDCNQAMGFHNLTMSECYQVRDFVASFVEQSIKKKEERDFTSIIATHSDTLEDCSAPRVTRLLARCAMMLTGSEKQFDTLKSILQDPVLIFCETNDEQDMLAEMFAGAVYSVRGSDSPDKKENAILAWCDGEMPWLISKASIVGFGMNFQHCAKVIFPSINFSYEKFYQAVRRVWRFGQDRVVECHVIISDTEGAIWSAIHGKAAKHEEMKRRMSDAMRRAQGETQTRVKYERPLELAFPEWIKGV